MNELCGGMTVILTLEGSKDLQYLLSTQKKKMNSAMNVEKYAHTVAINNVIFLSLLKENWIQNLKCGPMYIIQLFVWGGYIILYQYKVIFLSVKQAELS